MSAPFFVPRLGSISVFLLKPYSSHQQSALVFISDPSLFLKPTPNHQNDKYFYLETNS